MKKVRIITLSAILGILASACHMGRHSTIVETGNGRYLKIEYAGTIHFRYDGSGISSISRGGYIKYQNNDRKLEAHNDGHGGVAYELYDDGEQISYDRGGKEFIAEAVRVMLQKNHHPDWK